MTTRPNATQVTTALEQRGKVRKVSGELFFQCFFPEQHNNGDADPSARWNEQKAVWTCDVCKNGGGLKDIAERLNLVNGEPRPEPKVVASFDYRTADGTRLYSIDRWEPAKKGNSSKSFEARHPNPRGGSDHSGMGSTGNDRCPKIAPILYRIPEILNSPPDTPVFIPEGEGKVDLIYQKLSLPATCGPFGAGKFNHIADFSPLKGRKVIVLPDNDQPGRNHATEIIKRLRGIASLIKVLELPDLGPKGDVVDWVRRLEAGL